MATDLEAMDVEGELHNANSAGLKMIGIYLAIDVVVLMCIGTCLTLLILLHTFLATQGLTSWEYFRWMKITYMKLWPKKYGSPFSKGSKLRNFRAIFEYRRSKLAIQWEMPKSFPKLRV
jgi:hypothetical protein